MGIYRNRPPAYGDNNPNDGAPGRHSTYGESYVLGLGAGNWPLADEGSYFFACNPTVGTGIAGHAAPVVADTDTKALLHLYNSGDKNIILDFCQLTVTAAGTAGTIHHTVIYVDNKGATARTSAGDAITPVNTNAGVNLSSGAVIYFGPVVTAMTSSRKVGQQVVREVIPVAQDQILMTFGNSAPVNKSSITTAGTATAHVVQSFPAVVIPPGGNLNISQIRASQSAAASYEFQLGYWER